MMKLIGLLLLTGCASGFVPASSLPPPEMVTREQCLIAEQQASWWTAANRVAVGLSGAQGLATIPVESHRGEVALGVGVAVAGALALGASYMADASVPEACKVAGATVD
jgi:hypothetical protein